MTFFNLKKLFIIFALFMCIAPFAEAKEFSFVNKTGEDIVALNASPGISDAWYDVKLPNPVWKDGESIVIDFEDWMLTDTWDFRIYFKNNVSEDFYGVKVRNVKGVVLNKDGKNEYLQ